MSAIEAFYSTWSQARETFGSGVPQDGSEYDNSAKLRQLQSKIESAKPDDRWQGPAADAYAAKNQQHVATYGKLADLDQRMAAEVGRTAAVVTAGRQNLDQLRDWVTSAAGSVPNDRSGENMKLVIASKGINQISEIVKQSNDQMTAIGERIRGLGKEYDEIGGDKGKEKPEVSTLVGGMGPKHAPYLPKKQSVQLDLDDIRKKPEEIPFNYMELVPGSNVWVPDPSNPLTVPHPPKRPVNVNDLVFSEQSPNGPFTPYGATELLPGVWVPDPNNPYHTPTGENVPLDLGSIIHVHPDPSKGIFYPEGYVELGEGSGVWARKS